MHAGAGLRKVNDSLLDAVTVLTDQPLSSSLDQAPHPVVPCDGVHHSFQRLNAVQCIVTGKS